MLEELKNFNDFLEGVPLSVTKFFKTFFKSSEELTQSYVDNVCRWMAWRVNITVETARQWLIGILWSKYGSALGLIAAGEKVRNALSDPIGAIGGMLGEFFKPFAVIKEFITTLIKEVPRLAKNLANIMSVLPPEPPNPRINFDAFKLDIHTISMKDVINGPNMPTPEQMFPEPASPFSKESFNSAFEEAKKTSIAEGPIFKPKESGVKISGGTESDGTSIA